MVSALYISILSLSPSRLTVAAGHEESTVNGLLMCVYFV